MTFGEYLKHRREELGLRLCDVYHDETVICKYENGTRNPSQDMIQYLATMLHVEWKWLFIYSVIDADPNEFCISQQDQHTPQTRSRIEILGERIAHLPVQYQELIFYQCEAVVTTWEHWDRKHFPHRRQPPPKQTLYQWYHEQHMSIQVIADKCQCSYATAQRWLRDYKIPIRRISRPLLTQAELTELYVTQQFSLRKIGRQNKVAPTTVRQWMDFYGIPLRQSPLIPKTKLVQLYCQQQLSTRQIATHFKVSHGVILRKLHKYHIPVRRTGQRKQPQS